MAFIPLVNVLNISIILMVIIDFANLKNTNPMLFQIVDNSTDSYYVYLNKLTIANEIKMNIYEYFDSINNIEAKRYPSPSVTLYDNYVTEFNEYCLKLDSTHQYEPQYYIRLVIINIIKAFLSCLGKRYYDINDQNKNDVFMMPGKKYYDINDKYMYKEIKMAVPDFIVYVRQFFDTTNIDKFIDALNTDRGINGKEEIFYKCTLDFKNAVTLLNQKIGKYSKVNISKSENIELTKNDIKFLTRQKLEINFDSNGKLNNTQKKQILESFELKFINYVTTLSSSDNQIYLIRAANEQYKNFTYTSFRVTDNTRVIENGCKQRILNKNEFKISILSNMIYPNKSDNFYIYMEKRKLFVKHLEFFSTGGINKDDTDSIFRSYKIDNDEIEEAYYNKLKICRAIKEENSYDSYVIRLKMNECTPLSMSLWTIELTSL